MKWRPHTETPATDEPMTALLATRDDASNGEFFLLGIKLWRRGVWIDEQHFRAVSVDEFWWVPETEICAELAHALKIRPHRRRVCRG